MPKPFIVCHMMMSVDGRIDCGMTEKLKGTDEYYETLDSLNAPTTVSGRVTGKMELAEPGEFSASDWTPIGKEGFSKKTDAEGYDVVTDTMGSLLWRDDSEYDRPHVILCCERVPKEYLAYLDSRNISWIACGKERIDLKRAVGILEKEFGIERIAVVGGGHIDGGFLEAGLIDEISILIGPGIDGREGMPAVFDGRPMDRDPVALELKDVQRLDDGALWIRYSVLNRTARSCFRSIGNIFLQTLFFPINWKHRLILPISSN